MTLKLKLLLVAAAGFVVASVAVTRFAGAQGSYYTWNVIAGYTYPYQDLPPSVHYPFKIVSVSVTTPPKSSSKAKYCKLYLDVLAEQTAIANNQRDFDVDPTTLWKTDNGCILSLVGEPDVTAQVAIVTDDSATPKAVRASTMNALVFPDFSSPDCRKALMIDPGLKIYTQFLFPTSKPKATPKPKTMATSRVKPAPMAKPTPTATPTPNRYGANESAESPVDAAGDYRQPFAVTLPRTTSLRTVTFPHGPDCKSLTVFRPS
jgi:hypothetical protein